MAAEVISLDQIRARRLPVIYVPPAKPSMQPQERIVAAADLSMADKIERWAAGFVDDLMRFNSSLKPLDRRDIMRVVAIIDKRNGGPS